MASLLNITTPISPKNYDLIGKNAPPIQNDRNFTLSDTSKIVKTHDRSEEYTNQDLKDGGSNIGVDTSGNKNPSTAVSILKSIINNDTLDALKAQGDIDILNKVTEFANEVMLSPLKLSSDMITQEKEATIYNDPFWGAVKTTLENSSSPELSESIFLLAKAASDASSKNDILSSISSSLKFLADNAAPSKAIAELLNGYANKLSEETFSSVKGNILGIIGELQNSLLINDSSKNLLSLVIYNLSRYNSDSAALGESFNTVLDFMPTLEEAENLKQAFITYIENSNLPTDVRLSALESMALGNMTKASSLSLLAEKIGMAMNKYIDNIPLGNLEKVLGLVDSSGGTKALANLFSAMIPDNLSTGLNSILKSFDTTGNTASFIERLSVIVNSIDNMDAKIALANKVNDILAEITYPVTDLSKATDSVLNENSLTVLSEKLGNKLNEALNQIPIDSLSRLVSETKLSQGSASIRSILEGILAGNSSSNEELNLILRSFNSTGDLNKLIDNLSIGLNALKNLDKKIILAQGINEILENLTRSTNVRYKPPTSMSNLMDFLSKNINDSSLKSLATVSQNDILQGFLSSPGVFTPLLHFLVPINDDGFKAFGELWVDPDAEENNASAKNSNHLFLCFDVENLGYFEMEIKTADDNLFLTLLCPAGTEPIFSPLKNSVSTIAKMNGFNAKSTNIDTLISRRDLSQVFSKIQERKVGLNVKI